MPLLPRSILVPTDFSPAADAAVALATAMATAVDAELHLLHVRVLMADPALDEAHHETIDQLLAGTDEKVFEALQALHDDEEPRISHHVLRRFSVPEGILEVAADQGCDLVVVGTHGRRGLRHFLLGSVAEEVVRTSPVPVLTVRAEDRSVPSVPSRILVGCDFSDSCRTAVRWAGSWARATDGSVTLAHAVEPMVYPEFYAVDIFPQDMMDRIEQRSREAMEELARSELQDVTWSIEVLDGPPVMALTEAARTGRHDLLVVGHRGLSGFEELLIGSVASGLVRKSPIPVVTTRFPESEEIDGTAGTAADRP